MPLSDAEVERYALLCTATPEMIGSDPGLAPSPFDTHLRACKGNRDRLASFLQSSFELNNTYDLPKELKGNPTSVPLALVLAFIEGHPNPALSQKASRYLDSWKAVVSRIVWHMLVPRLPFARPHQLPKDHPAALEYQNALWKLSWEDLDNIVSGTWARAGGDGDVFPSHFDWVGPGCPELGIPEPRALDVQLVRPDPVKPHVPLTSVIIWIRELDAFRTAREAYRMRLLEYQGDVAEIRDLYALFERGITRDELITFIFATHEKSILDEESKADGHWGGSWGGIEEGGERPEEKEWTEEEKEWGRQERRSWRVRALDVHRDALKALIESKLDGRSNEARTQLLRSFDLFRADLQWVSASASREDARRALLSTFPPLSSIPLGDAERTQLQRREAQLTPPSPPAYPELQGARLDDHLPLRNQHGITAVQRARTLGSVRAEVALRLAGAP